MSEFTIDFPTLGDLGDRWITAHCRVPQGFARGKPFQMADWQFWCHANRYRVRPEAVFVRPEDVGPDNPPTLNQAFHYRRTLIVAPQKTGKGPLSASQVAFEACGPSVFGGWADGGEIYRCSDWGCSCGFDHEFLAGEPMGIRHPSPLIQITANSADQAENIYGPLRAMIALGPLKETLAVREGFVRILGLSGLDDLDRIDVVTSSARSRLGNPISDAEQDEAGLYTQSNKMVEVADTQARGAAGMGGRTHLTTNAWDPGENSYAQQIFELDEDDTFVFYRDPDQAVELRRKDGKPLDYKDKDDRRHIHEYVYRGSWWVNLDSIEADAASLMKRDPAQAERFFGNRRVTGGGAWMDMSKWALKGYRQDVDLGVRLCGGFDGSDNNDHTAIRLETLDGYQFTPTYGADKRKAYWKPQDWGGRIPHAEVMAAWDEIATVYKLIRVYWDPKFWESECDELASRHGDKVFVKWETNRINPMHAALDRFRTDVYNPDSDFTHDEDRDADTHMRNAFIRSGTIDSVTLIRRYTIGKPFGEDHRKMDISMSSTLAHEARMDALAKGIDDEPQESFAWI
ncbi:hypothetical protein [Microbacterium jejuense]|uniref:hypothetical protein n=1 Tax=Microbacterium jejuense TaxID=1263637 RepID=UPI0031F0B458